MEYTVYCHVNKTNGKRYVGITKNVEQRWRLNGVAYKKQNFYKAIKKYGWEGFEHVILKTGLSLEDAKKAEIEYIALYNSINPFGYNVSKGGDLTSCTPEIAQKISQNRKGIRPTSEQRQRMSDACKGRHHTEDTKEKIRQARLGQKLSPEARKKLSAYHTGRSLSPEAIEKMRKKISGKNSSSARKVEQWSVDGKLIAVFDTMVDAAKHVGGSPSQICECCRGKKNKDGRPAKSGGFIWKYAES